MPVSIDAYAKPSWVKHDVRYPLIPDKEARFNTICPRDTMARYNGDSDTGWKQSGYNPNHNSTRVERINLKTDNITLKPY